MHALKINQLDQVKFLLFFCVCARVPFWGKIWIWMAETPSWVLGFWEVLFWMHSCLFTFCLPAPLPAEQWPYFSPVCFLDTGRHWNMEHDKGITSVMFKYASFVPTENLEVLQTCASLKTSGTSYPELLTACILWVALFGTSTLGFQADWIPGE